MQNRSWAQSSVIKHDNRKSTSKKNFVTPKRPETQVQTATHQNQPDGLEFTLNSYAKDNTNATSLTAALEQINRETRTLGKTLKSKSAKQIRRANRP